jgi:hypothetical protein
LRLHLYVNDITPTANDLLAQYHECTAAGYASIVLTGNLWSFVIDSTSQIATASFPEQTFALTSSTSVYGYYITDQTSALVILAERFTNAPSIISGTGNILVTPKLRLQ